MVADFAFLLGDASPLGLFEDFEVFVRGARDEAFVDYATGVAAVLLVADYRDSLVSPHLHLRRYFFLRRANELDYLCFFIGLLT